VVLRVRNDSRTVPGEVVGLNEGGVALHLQLLLQLSLCFLREVFFFVNEGLWILFIGPSVIVGEGEFVTNVVCVLVVVGKHFVGIGDLHRALLSNLFI